MLGVRKLSDRLSSNNQLFDGATKNLVGLGRENPTDQKTEQKSNRVKTQFLGFKTASQTANGEQNWNYQDTAERPDVEASLGRLVVVHGPGRGHSFALKDDVNRIGRGEGQEIRLTFGDTSVSRKRHATIVYYGKRGGFTIRDGRTVNPVRLNGRSLQGDEHLENGDLIRIGETTLRFFAFVNHAVKKA